MTNGENGTVEGRIRGSFLSGPPHDSHAPDGNNNFVPGRSLEKNLELLMIQISGDHHPGMYKTL